MKKQFIEFIPADEICPVCNNEDTVYSSRYDTHACPVCKTWIEICLDKDCKVCKSLPPYPFDGYVDIEI